MKFVYFDEYCEIRVFWFCYIYRVFFYVYLFDLKVDVFIWKRSIVIFGIILSVSGDGF